ncbi:ribosome biogenesis GTP-binding protein YihA/YsxC [Buchnera aphidicola]|uniref:Probable GTP-binding protein EngB n=1 Tax=Buchnera aphidicola (Cinara strobi) TaxID=1921549 RepID=A0A3B1E7Y3_9GAMM|nr:ribosome biogenesis GTP-binding protein YihA/YsxC [Buchnera aphidicola]VAX76687.1 Probable GTP-binding protein EngB [Buchnera aphidicola (Cinara strobi)]
MNNIKFDRTFFLKSIVDFNTLKDFLGIEVAFLGYSNVGKSSIINCLTKKKKLARISKFPGSTSTINFFSVFSDFRIIDFPGYGYSKIGRDNKISLTKSLFFYLKKRQCLKGVVLLSDIRHSIKPIDQLILKIIKQRLLPVLIILTKSDKVSKQEEKKIVLNVYKKLLSLHMNVIICSFSKFNMVNMPIIESKLSEWYSSS